MVAPQARRVRSLILLSCLLAGPGPAAGSAFDGDFRIWNEFMVREWSRGPWYTYTWGETRWVDDANRLGTWVLQQKLTRTLRPGLKFSTGGAFIQVLRADGSRSNLSRLEFQVDPSWKLGARDQLQLRNRIETRWWDDRDTGTEIWVRHRVRWVHRASWLPGMERIEFSNEFFWDFETDRLAENRLRLFDTFFRPRPDLTLDAYLQVRSLRGAGAAWNHACVLGLGLRWYPR